MADVFKRYGILNDISFDRLIARFAFALYVIGLWFRGLDLDLQYPSINLEPPVRAYFALFVRVILKKEEETNERFVWVNRFDVYNCFDCDSRVARLSTRARAPHPPAQLFGLVNLISKCHF